MAIYLFRLNKHVIENEKLERDQRDLEKPLKSETTAQHMCLLCCT